MKPHPLAPSPISLPAPRRERGNEEEALLPAILERRLNQVPPLPGAEGWEMGEGDRG